MRKVIIATDGGEFTIYLAERTKAQLEALECEADSVNEYELVEGPAYSEEGQFIFWEKDGKAKITAFKESDLDEAADAEGFDFIACGDRENNVKL